MTSFYDVLMWLIPLALTAAVGLLFGRLSGPLARLKRLWTGTPIFGILGAAAVMIAEAVYSEYDGEEQFRYACEALARFTAGTLTADQVEELVEKAYHTLKQLWGEHWELLKINLAMAEER